ncbi:hypothetical protein IQ06DRAFT_299298 [Phaeosphaeriaceae sp. SRC1lsM3a]|nr:hypothetical protein IQ06DRAFT_299298 [Stagonospora sp. SRC1lsM3a]
MLFEEASTSQKEPVSIEIQTQAHDDTEAWRFAVLSCDPKSNRNKISQTLVNDVLHASIQRYDKEAVSGGHDRKDEEEIDGFVDLTWNFEINNKRIYNTRFFVTSSKYPPYDAVLGKKDAKHVGML